MSEKEISVLQIDLTPAGRERFEVLKTKINASDDAEVVRRALAVYETLIDAAQEGKQIFFQQKGKPRETLNTGILLPPRH